MTGLQYAGDMTTALVLILLALVFATGAGLIAGALALPNTAPVPTRESVAAMKTFLVTVEKRERFDMVM